ncbi:MAG: hypothetical protein RL346_2256 [Verrucomicrobiota bacterium]
MGFAWSSGHDKMMFTILEMRQRATPMASEMNLAS